MKIVHTADSHLGAVGFGLSALVQDPGRPGVMVRQRQLDVQNGFASAVDAAISASADIFMHCGDVFDSARPPAFALDFAMSQLKRLTDLGIGIVIVEGNHSYPRDPALGHAVQILTHLNGVHVAFDQPKVFELAGVTFHAYPHKAVSLGDWPSPKALKGRTNILTTHGVADGQAFFRGNRPAPQLAIDSIAGSFAYVALGHYHRFAQIPKTDNAFYSGAPAMVTWNDFRAGHRFSVAIVDPLSDQLVTLAELPTRDMRAYGLDDATGLSRRDVLDRLVQQESARRAVGANCRISVEGLDELVRREINLREVEEIFAGAAAMQISIRAREQRWESVQAAIAEGGQLSDRFAQLANQLDCDEPLRVDVKTLGESVLSLADERLSDIDAEDNER